jgi:hypothetical protein
LPEDTVSASGDSEALRSIPGQREYRARFLSEQLQNIIVLVSEDGPDRSRALHTPHAVHPRSSLVK